ncbi:MAG: tRNA pseudouridine synthase [Chthonomonadaceae bacterium]|nr:tRNA pseudouridine synthase [Chthonomonadaceae bacterium]
MSSPASGVVVVNKPAGMTSHDVVDVIRRLFRTKRVGHTGTLDPDATGVLVLCIGNATRLVEYLTAHRKHYVTQIVLGVETDTQDASGSIVVERPADHLTEADLLALLPQFRGTIEQIPPMVSARHHEGKRLYDLARAGITVEREARPVQIDALELTAFQSGRRAQAILEVTCSTGTYIRTLAADIGTAAGTGGMMQTLLRTWVGTPNGAFTLAAAHTLEELRRCAEDQTLPAVVVPLEQVVADWIVARLTERQVARFRMGQAVPRSELSLDEDLPVEASPVAVLDNAGSMCGIAKLDAEFLHPVKVFPSEVGD